MFHAYQFSRTDPSDWGSRLLNNEVEAHAAEYLYLRRKGLLEAGSPYYESYTYSVGGQAASRIISRLDDSGNLNGNPNVIINRYNQAANKLQQVPDYKDMSYNSSLSGLEGINLLQSILEDC